MTSLRCLVYLVDARLPTEKAHGWQIVKMCEAFSRAGAGVELRYPDRRQHDPALAGVDVRDYYSVDRTFRVTALPTIDVVALEPLLPAPLAERMIQARSAVFLRRGVAELRTSRDALCYTRDIAAAHWTSRSGVPSAYEVHGLPGPRARRLLASMSRRREPRLFVALTPYIAEALERSGIRAERIVVEGDAVDLRAYVDLPDRLEARARLGLPRDRPIVGFVGRFQTLEREKGLPELVEAMGRVSARDGQSPLLLCLGGPLDAVPAYLEIARRAGLAPDGVRFHDRVRNEQVPLWIRALDVATMPYPATPHIALAASPLKMFEYLAARTPVVATDLPSTRLLLHDRNAVLVPAGDVPALAAGIDRLLHDRGLADGLATRGLKDVSTMTWEARASRILERLDVVLRKEVA